MPTGTQSRTERRAQRGLSAQGGFSLLELMIVIVILGVIVGVALPSYRNSVVKANRAEAKAALTTMAQRQEQVRLNNGSYTTTMANVWSISDNQDCDSNPATTTLNNRTENCLYVLSAPSASTTAYSMFAAPQTPQSTDDTACGTLGLDSRGLKTITGTASVEECW